MLKKNHKIEEGIGYILLSVMFLSVYSLCVKWGIEGISIWILIFVRFFVPLLLLMPFFWWSGVLKRVWPMKDLRSHLYRSGAIILGQGLLIYYLTQGTLLNATILWGTAPIFMPIIARVVYKQRTEIITWITVLISAVGVGIILKPDKGIFDPFILYGLLAGFFVAVSQLLYGKTSEKGNIGKSLFYLFFFCSLWSVIPLLIFKPAFSSQISLREGLAVFGVCLATIGNQMFRGFAYQMAPALLLTPFLYFSVILSGAFDWIFFHKPPDGFAILGTGLVIGAAILKWTVLSHRHRSL